MDLDVIVLNYNTKKLLTECLESIYKYKWQKKIQVTVVDNASVDGSSEMINKDFGQVKLIQSSKNLGFSGGNNLGLKKLNARYGLLLNSDTIVLEGSLDGLVNFMDESDFGVGSCKLVYPDKSFQPNAGDLPSGLALFVWISGLDDVLPFFRKSLPSFHRKFKNYYRSAREVGWVSGTAMMIKKETISKIGLLDDAIFMYGEDVEYCLRAQRHGIRVGWTNRATIIHLGGASSDNPSLRQWIGEMRGLIYVYKKYFGFLPTLFLRFFIYAFTLLRMVAFTVVGRPKVARTYGQVLLKI